MKKAVTFGEIMLRLKPPNMNRIIQTNLFEATFGGGEANVAVSLANYGLHSAYVTVLPNNEIGKSAIIELSQYGVDTKEIVYGSGRMGIYFLEAGAAQRPSKVVYDRENSSVSLIEDNMIEWNKVLHGADWFHITGITPAISHKAAIQSIKAVKKAKEEGLTVSCDLNYRAKLWKYGVKPKEIMEQIVEYADVIIANEEDIQNMLGILPDAKPAGAELKIEVYKKLSDTVLDKFKNLKLVAVTLRESKNANENGWSACLNDRNSFMVSKKYNITDIVDRVGAGDAFSAGLIYGLIHSVPKQEALEFAVGAGCLKHTISGDFNLVSVDEINNLVKGDVTGRIQR